VASFSVLLSPIGRPTRSQLTGPWSGIARLFPVTGNQEKLKVYSGHRINYRKMRIEVIVLQICTLYSHIKTVFKTLF
jgi:hypothetical protein